MYQGLTMTDERETEAQVLDKSLVKKKDSGVPKLQLVQIDAYPTGESEEKETTVSQESPVPSTSTNIVQSKQEKGTPYPIPDSTTDSDTEYERKVHKIILDWYDTTPSDNQHPCSVVIYNVEKDRGNSREMCIKLRDLFEKKLQFKDVYTNIDDSRNLDETLLLLKKYFQQNDSHIKSAIVIFMAHGDEQGIRDNDGRKYRYSEIIDIFRPKEKHEAFLTGKPKLIMFQSCRGNEINRGFHTGVSDAPVGQLTEDNQGFKPKIHPWHADMMIFYATAEGFKSHRYKLATHFDKVLRILYAGYHLAEILTAVHYMVAEDEQSLDKDDTQMPQHISTLRKNWMLHDFNPDIMLPEFTFSLFLESCDKIIQ